MRARFFWLACAVILATLLLPGAALAQDEATVDEHNRVMLVTFVIAVALLGVASVGFLYRRQKGMLPPADDSSAHGADHH
jgi:hypothetical protein